MKRKREEKNLPMTKLQARVLIGSSKKGRIIRCGNLIKKKEERHE